jgi:glycosyltransferase involved in cell wall biosynthesis
MRILYVAPSTERIPPYRYGAVGRIVDNLIQGCFELGQDIDLVASGDSRTRARRVLPPVDHPTKYSAATIEKTLEIIAREVSDYDVVHNHDSFLAEHLEDITGAEVLSTCHQEQNTIWSSLRNQHLVALSQDQANRIRSPQVVDVIPPCINISEFTPSVRSGDYLLILSKLSRKKGILDAVEIAARSERRLVLAGPVFPKDKEFYIAELAPKIDGEKIVYFGEAVERERRELLRNASALIFPNSYGEPFGMVMLEALACGTPIIAMGNNAAGEVIEHSRTGFLAADVDDACSYVGKLSELDPQQCRRTAEKYDYHIISGRYLQLYCQLLTTGMRPPPIKKSFLILHGELDTAYRQALTHELSYMGRAALAEVVIAEPTGRLALAGILEAAATTPGTTIVWDEMSISSRPDVELTTRFDIVDITFTGLDGKAPDTGNITPVKDTRDLVPSILVSKHLPADRLARQIMSMQRARRSMANDVSALSGRAEGEPR